MSHHDHGVKEKLVQFVREAHAMETNTLMMLQSLQKTTADGELRAAIERHVAETRAQRGRLEGRLGALGATPDKVKETGAVLGSIAKGVTDQVRPDKPGRNARDAYVSEHLEIAAYELLIRIAERAGDAETAEVARTNLAEERAMADAVAASWDRVADQTLASATT
ncbi:MAG TPA: DUF892 family protein [Actinomycetota bacterium]|nr:DUF892 family protein [Actinomycetota bacterium]